MNPDDSREIGRMQADIENLTKAVERLTTKVELLTDTMARVKGGWFVITSVAAAGGGVGALLTWIIRAKTGG